MYKRQLVNGRVELVSREADRLLQEALAAAAGGPLTLRNKGVSLPIAGEDGRDFVLHMMPLDIKRCV